MPARLFCKQGELKDLTFEVTGDVSVGRQPGNDIVLPAPTISGRHARIRWEADARAFVLEDLGSATGTQLDGYQVTSTERLGSLHVITFGNAFDFIFQDLGPPARPGDAVEPAAVDHTVQEAMDVVLPAALVESPAGRREEASPATERTRVEGEAVGLPSSLAQRSVPDPAGKEAADQGAGVTHVELEPPGLPSALARDSEPPPSSARRRDRVLEIDLGDGNLKRIVLRLGDNVVGRSRSAAVRLNHSDVSRRHAVIHVEGDRVTVRDEGSANHTFVDDRRVEGEVEVPAGAILRFGGFRAHIVE